MRRLPILLVLLLAACGNQGRDFDDEDPWEDYDPDSDAHTYDEAYVPPSRMDADQLVQRAKRNEANGRDDEARVDYQAAFKRDRWHPGANSGYQDLMLRNDLFETVWQEYLDLWQKNPERGDAFWFHLRPMLQVRDGTPITWDIVAKISYEQSVRVDDLKAEATTKAAAGDREGAIAAIDAALAIFEFPSLHRLRIGLLQTGDYTTLLEEYAARAEDNPQSGDRLYLHALVLSLRDPVKALNMLREGWIIELPGYWVSFGMAETCIGMGDNETEARSKLGWYAVAKAFLQQCLDLWPADNEAATMLGYVTEQMKK